MLSDDSLDVVMNQIVYCSFVVLHDIDENLSKKSQENFNSANIFC